MTHRFAAAAPPFTAFLLAAVLVLGTFVALSGCGGGDQTPATVEEAVEETAPPAATAQPASAPLAEGRQLYVQYCQSCHGPGGEGNGDLVGDLDTLPGDLTLITSNNNGAYPVDEIISVIDGTKEVTAHESREMPIWGNIWSEQNGNPVPDEIVQNRINALVEYLRSLQK